MEEKCPRCGSYLVDGKCPYCLYESAEVVEDQPKPTVNHPPKREVQSVPPVQQVTSNQNVNSVSPKNLAVAILLCFFLGIFGAHRFYAGKIVSGIVYLFTCGAFGIGVIVDFILLILGKFTDSNGLPIK